MQISFISSTSHQTRADSPNGLQRALDLATIKVTRSRDFTSAETRSAR
jgi:hypothetical protein